FLRKRRADRVQRGLIPRDMRFLHVARRAARFSPETCLERADRAGHVDQGGDVRLRDPDRVWGRRWCRLLPGCHSATDCAPASGDGTGGARLSALTMSPWVTYRPVRMRTAPPSPGPT